MVCCQVSVAVIRKMDRVLVRSLGKENAASIFAKKLHDSWGVGHAECNDGAVIFLSIDDRRSFVSTGAGLKKLVPGKPLLPLFPLPKAPLCSLDGPQPLPP